MYMSELYCNAFAPIIIKNTGTSNPSLTHFHDEYEIVLFEHCDIRVFCQNKWYSLRDGDIFYVPTRVIHRYDYLYMQHYTRTVISYKAEDILPFLRAIGCESLLDNKVMRSSHKLTPSHNTFIQLLRKADDLLDVYTISQETNEALVNGIVQARLASILYEVMLLCQTHTKSDMRTKSNAYVQRAIQYIDTHYAENPSLDVLADKLHISKYHLCHLFKQHTGLSVIKYLQYRRIIEAQKMMLYNNKPIALISDACGFGSLQHFYRVFREIAGCSPAQYQKAAAARERG
jgi:AraC-like DNA-binding protein